MATPVTEMTVGIVEAQAKLRAMEPEEIQGLIKSVFNTINALAVEEKTGVKVVEAATVVEEVKDGVKPVITPMIDPANSIGEDFIICVVCNKKFRQITHKHLNSHNLTPEEYREMFGFSRKQALVCKKLSAQRSKTAQANDNLGKRPRKPAAATPTAEPTAQTE
jgi:predicted transcriptional regulator